MTSKLITITDGNIRNNHLYMASIFDMIEVEAIGANDKRDGEGRAFTIEWDGPSPRRFESDIAGRKRFFRNRTMHRTFFEDTGARPGDQVAVTRLGPFHLRFSLIRAAL